MKMYIKPVEEMDDYIYHIEDTEKTPLEDFIKEISAALKQKLNILKSLKMKNGRVMH